jgi:hypothetical protein
LLVVVALQQSQLLAYHTHGAASSAVCGRQCCCQLLLPDLQHTKLHPGSTDAGDWLSTHMNTLQQSGHAGSLAPLLVFQAPKSQATMLLLLLLVLVR